MSEYDLLSAMMPVVRCLEALNITHYVGGSVASSALGMPRTTTDADLVAELEFWHVDRFVAALADDYYVSVSMIQTAIERQSCFNLIHHATSYKVDVFVAKSRPYDQSCLARIQRGPVGESEEDSEVWLPSPEDVVLNKLEWYSKADRVSERQWLDVQGVLQVQRDRLDVDYMRHWARELDIVDLLAEALAEAGIDDSPEQTE
jgi:hypothetical protein